MANFTRLAGAAVLFMSMPAVAQDTDGTREDLRVRLGLGAQVAPKYVGADDRRIGPLWDVAVARGSDPFEFEAPDDSFDIKLHSRKKLSFGPVAAIESGRKNSDVGAPVGRVSTTIEAGAFVQYQASKSVRLRGEVRRGIGGHEGTIASLGADRIWRDGDRYTFSIGPRLMLSDGRYQRTWFGVSPAASALTGLPRYRPGAGIHAVAATSGATYQIGSRWGLFGYARFERLVGDAAKSPLVREFGSKTQLSAGAGLAYTFNIRR